MGMMTIFIGYNNYIYDYKQKRQKPYFGFWNRQLRFKMRPSAADLSRRPW